MKLIRLIRSLNLNLNIYFGLCTFLDIYIWTHFFLFCVDYSAIGIMLAKHGFMTCGEPNFMKEKEAWEDCK